MMKSIRFFTIIILFLSSCAQKSSEDQVIEWVSENAILFNSVLPGSDTQDLLPFRDMVGDARIVALGEPTHGNREVFQLKHRMIEYLVTEMGFNIFALECPFGEAVDVNRYVLDGIGDPEKTLAGIYMWNWDTEEFIALLKWLRAYNANPEHKKKVKFYGFDAQYPERGARVMLAYLEKVDPELAEKVHAKLGILQVPFSNPESLGGRQWNPSEYDSMSLRDIRLVMTAFDINKNEYAAASSPLEWKWAKQHARQVELYIEANTDDGLNYNKVRDLGQAQNIQWILNHEGDEGKAIVWAHNAHVGNTERKGYVLMGYHLRQWYGEELKIFGLFFNQGGFKALDEALPSKGMHHFSVGPAPKGTFEYIMASNKLKIAALDLQQLPTKGDVHNWFNEPQLARNSWGGYKENDPKEYLYPYKLKKEFDVLMYIDSTTPVKHTNDSDFDYAWLLNQKLNEPTNTYFEDNNIGEEPNGWSVWSKFKRLGVKITTSGENPFQGKKSVKINHSADLAYGEIGPNVVQRIDATPYRGKTIRFRAAARAELENPGFAFLRLAIEPNPIESAYEVLPPLFDSLDDERVESSEWKVYEIEAEVPENADIISYGIYLRDFGSVWLDAVEIVVLE